VKALLLLLVMVACSDGKKAEPKREPERQRRVIPEPPTPGVRALPPHAIRADGVGPYKLGATVTQLLDQLPSGPRITQFTLPNVIQRDILRAEGDAILIGTEPQGTAKFVSVVEPDIARTEAGVHVGSSRAELERGLGAPLVELDRAHDPRIVIPSNLKNARVLLAGDRVDGIVITADADRAKDAGGEPRDFIVKEGSDDELLVVTREGEKFLGRYPLPGLVFGAALRNPSDGRDDIVAITRTEDTHAQSRTWSLVLFRLHDGKLLRGEERVLYTLTAASARWIGAEIRDLELYIELSGRADSIEVGGLLTTRIGDKLRDIVVITTVSVPRRRAKATPHEPIDAGTSDAH
jgi:hypothetical protein